MRLNLKAALLTSAGALLGVASALAQPAPINPANLPSPLPVMGLQDSQGINTTSPNGLMIGGVGAITPLAGYPSYHVGPSVEGGTPAYDLSSGGNIRLNTSFATLIASVPTTSQHWQQNFTSTTLQSGVFNYEIMPGFYNLIVNAPSTVVQSNDVELRLDNYGTMAANGSGGIFAGLLYAFSNYTTGQIGALNGISFSMGNSNTAAGSIGNLFWININPFVTTGGGTLPTNFLAWRNVDINAGFVNISHALFGGTAGYNLASNVTLQVSAQTGTNFAFYISSPAGANIFNISGAGTGGFMAGTLTMGSAAAGAGSISFYNGASAGTVNLSANSTMTSSVNVKFPALTLPDTLVTLGIPSTFTALQTYANGGTVTVPLLFATLTSNYPCAVGTKGFRGVVSDGAASPVFMATAAGGGTTATPVVCNGTAYVNG
jgi:hypothetical protein